MEEVSRQNMAMMERAFSLFSPFYRPSGDAAGAGGSAADQTREEVATLRAEVERLRQELARSKAEKA